MTEDELRYLKAELITAIKEETHEAIKHTGHTWIEEAVRKIVPVAIESCMIRLGMEPSEPLLMQRDFSWVRKMREESESKRKVLMTAMINWVTPLSLSGLLAWLISSNK